MNTKVKIWLISITLLSSISIPLLILYVFEFIFADYYSKVILGGLAHLFIGLVMVIINVATMPLIIYKYYKKYVINDSDGYGTYNFVKTAIISLLVIILMQIILSILIENPFMVLSSSNSNIM